MSTIKELAEALKKTEKQTISYMIKKCKEIDYECVPDNEFTCKKEVDVWWNERKENTDLIFKIFDEYYGVVETIETLNSERSGV